MLQQILQQMYVEPELLERLNEDDRRHLFGKMREEQVRRWNVWQDEVDNTVKGSRSSKPRPPPKPKSKRVQFLLGSDGNPWTWVIDDLPVNEIPTDPEDGQLDRTPVPCQLLKCHTKDLTDVRGNVSTVTTSTTPPLAATTTQLEDEESEDRDVRATLSRARLLARILEQNSVDNERVSWLKRRQDRIIQVMRSPSPTRGRRGINESVIDGPRTGQQNNNEDMPKAQEVFGLLRSTQNKAKDIRRTLERAHIRDEVGVLPEDHNQKGDVVRRARLTIRNVNSAMASKNKRNNEVSHGLPRSATLPVTRTRNRPLKPPSRDAIIEWFRSEERLRGTGWDAEHNCVEPWFHGMMSRQEAEDALAHEPKGTFLVRFCERIWGYAVSYRGAEKCKHYLIDASNDHYQFLGEGFKKFKKFGDLVKFYQIFRAKRPGLSDEALPKNQQRTDTEPAVLVKQDQLLLSEYVTAWTIAQ